MGPLPESPSVPSVTVSPASRIVSPPVSFGMLVSEMEPPAVAPVSSVSALVPKTVPMEISAAAPPVPVSNSELASSVTALMVIGLLFVSMRPAKLKSGTAVALKPGLKVATSSAASPNWTRVLSSVVAVWTVTSSRKVSVVSSAKVVSVPSVTSPVTL